MKRKLAGLLCGCAAVVDVSTFAHEFGGTEAVADGAGGPGFTVQSAQKADHSFCKTGVLPPPPA